MVFPKRGLLMLVGGLLGLLILNPSIAFGQTKKVCVNGRCYDVVSERVIAINGVSVESKVSSAAVETQSVETLGFRSDPNFRRQLIAAAEKSQAEGKISRTDLMKIRLVTLTPGKLKQIEQVCFEQAVADGYSAQQVDWTKLFDILKDLVPIVLELIKLFS
jgi:hypothetical protein